jgi:hypothetical protein
MPRVTAKDLAQRELGYLDPDEGQGTAYAWLVPVLAIATALVAALPHTTLF